MKHSDLLSTKTYLQSTDDCTHTYTCTHTHTYVRTCIRSCIILTRTHIFIKQLVTYHNIHENVFSFKAPSWFSCLPQSRYPLQQLNERDNDDGQETHAEAHQFYASLLIKKFSSHLILTTCQDHHRYIMTMIRFINIY